MKTVFRSLNEAAGRFGPCALTIGNFDGVHLGHRTLIRQTQQVARNRGWRTGVLTFDPHPAFVVAPERAPQMICSLQDRLRLLEEAGAERILVLPFTREVAMMEAREFIEKVMVETLEARAVAVGQSFRFGRNQLGTPAVLAELGAKHGFECHFLAPIMNRGEIISSTAIRRHLVEGKVSRAGRMLGRCFSITGDVVEGHGIGSKQTVPTLNLKPGPEILPALGVYITEAEDLSDGRRWRSITNIGTRPTFGGGGVTIETFLLSPFDGANPEHISIHLRRWVRAERTFPDPQSLQAQIFKDVQRANTYWRRLGRVHSMAGSK
ncbi:MAG: riboflavin biosynthesis protein RibF [Bryobacteraceae bacterium]